MPSTAVGSSSSSSHPNHDDEHDNDVVVEFHIVGDVFVDMLCFLQAGHFPTKGGDAHLTHPVQLSAGGSALNSATYLNFLSLLSSPSSSSSKSSKSSSSSSSCVTLHSAYNPDDKYGKLIHKHVQTHGFQMNNCYYNKSINNVNKNKNKDMFQPTTTRQETSQDKNDYENDNGHKAAIRNKDMQCGDAHEEEEEQIDESSPSLSTGHCICIVSENDRSFMTHGGIMSNFKANMLRLFACDDEDYIATSTTVKKNNDATTSANINRHVHIAGYYNLPGFWNGQLLNYLQQKVLQRTTSTSATTTISLVTQYDATEQWDGGLLDLLPMLDFLIMNEVEVQRIIDATHKAQQDEEEEEEKTSIETETNHPRKEQQQQQQHALWATQLNQIYKKNVATTTTTSSIIFVITLGERGAIAIRDGRVIAQQRARKVEHVVDPTGAGRCLRGRFLKRFMDNSGWGFRQHQQEKHPGPSG